MAVNCCNVPLEMPGLIGVTAIEIRTARVTVNVADAEMVPEVAVMIDEPTPVPVANPELVIVALVASEESQVT